MALSFSELQKRAATDPEFRQRVEVALKLVNRGKENVAFRDPQLRSITQVLLNVQEAQRSEAVPTRRTEVTTIQELPPKPLDGRPQITVRPEEIKGALPPQLARIVAQERKQEIRRRSIAAAEKEVKKQDALLFKVTEAPIIRGTEAARRIELASLKKVPRSVLVGEAVTKSVAQQAFFSPAFTTSGGIALQLGRSLEPSTVRLVGATQKVKQNQIITSAKFVSSTGEKGLLKTLSFVSQPKGNIQVSGTTGVGILAKESRKLVLGKGLVTTAKLEGFSAFQLGVGAKVKQRLVSAGAGTVLKRTGPEAFISSSFGKQVKGISPLLGKGKFIQSIGGLASRSSRVISG